MVLIAVLWMVAALAIVVTGMVSAVRKEIRLTGMSRQILLASAQGDAAMHLVLQSLKAQPTPPASITRVTADYGGQTIAVQVQPLNGLIDLNNAPKELLTSLLVVAGGLDRPVADALAQLLIDTRSRKDARGAPLGFEAVEDLLAIPGVDYALYARLKNLATADIRGAGRVNPLAASREVLTVLADGN
ncbi:MAG: hypothetical protein RLZZ401_2238, partial [Pseudomonadota bacterium]